ncbi:MAG TPA: HDOD domain-containing protein [Candidatus Deferrimicrobium sp.]|nr:HDOD domain-containing protein [Candidatus Deferrimicrobium sp.]
MNYENIEQQGTEIFVARQPIFDIRRNVYAYELLFSKGFQDYASHIDGEYATLKVISNSLIIGLNQLTGGKRAFINFNRHLLVGKVPQLFPKDLLGVEILEEIVPDTKVIGICKKMKEAGYLLILDDFIFIGEYRPLVHLADIIKIDFQGSTPGYRRSILKDPDCRHVKFLAEKIETQVQFEEAAKLGYCYFQGFFFQKPDIVSTRDMPGNKLNYLQILKKLCDPDLPIDEIERVLKHDVSLTYKLLRFINSAAYGFMVTIRSIRHALVLLGKREVKKWLTLIALSGVGGDKPLELLHNTLVRARFCELIGEDLHKNEEKADFFLVGMFSMADAFLGRPMNEILDGLPLDSAIKCALVGEPGTFRDVLDIVLAYERADWIEAARLSKQLALGEGKLMAHYIESVQWVRAF